MHQVAEGAKEIDPYFDQPWYWRVYGTAYGVLRRQAEALAMLDHMRVGRFRSLALVAACHAELGDLERAGVCAGECLARKPDFGILRYLRKNHPFKREEHALQLAASLRLAGLHE